MSSPVADAVTPERPQSSVAPIGRPALPCFHPEPWYRARSTGRVCGVDREYGADTYPGLHSVTAQPWTEEYQIAYLKMNHGVFDRLDAVVGEQVWNFADFATTSGVMRVGDNEK
jgi:glycosyl hydrolase family 2